METYPLETHKSATTHPTAMWIVLFIAFVLSVAGVGATTSFQYSRFLGNDTIEKFGSVAFDSDVNDKITSGNFYQSYVNYNTWIDTWNNATPQYHVKYCTMEIDEAIGNNNLTNLFIENFTTDTNAGKYFITLYQRGDAYYVHASCVFDGERPSTTISPMDFTIVTPTPHCQACQFYNWAKAEVTRNSAKTASDYTTTNIGFISNFFDLAYELIIDAFYFLMIFLLLLVVGIIFFGVYWVFNYMQKKVRI